MDWFSRCCAPASNTGMVVKSPDEQQEGAKSEWVQQKQTQPVSPTSNRSTDSPGSNGRPTSGGMSTDRCGVGIMFETELDKEYGCCRVEGIAQYSEAYESRILQKGDLLWEVDGKSAAHKSLPELSCMIMGPPGSKVELTFKKSTGENFKSVVTRISPLSILNKTNRPVVNLESSTLLPSGHVPSQPPSAYSSAGSTNGTARFSS